AGIVVGLIEGREVGLAGVRGRQRQVKRQPGARLAALRCGECLLLDGQPCVTVSMSFASGAGIAMSPDSPAAAASENSRTRLSMCAFAVSSSSVGTSP